MYALSTGPSKMEALNFEYLDLRFQVRKYMRGFSGLIMCGYHVGVLVQLVQISLLGKLT